MVSAYTSPPFCCITYLIGIFDAIGIPCHNRFCDFASILETYPPTRAIACHGKIVDSVGSSGVQLSFASTVPFVAAKVQPVKVYIGLEVKHPR